MPAYTSRQFTNNPNAGVGAYPGNMIGFFFEVAVTANVTNTDTFTFGKVPKGFRIFGATLESTSMAASGLTLSVGDSGSATRLVSASAIGVGGGQATAAATATHYLYPDDTIITGTAAGTIGTPTTGTLQLSVWGRFEGTPS
ncbi:MAG: hypothetical protein ACK52K_15150 [Alphaproteobacteria bacterium]|jgi:hypothetical protein